MASVPRESEPQLTQGCRASGFCKFKGLNRQHILNWSFSAVLPVSSQEEIETVTAASSVTGNSDTPIIYGGIIFESG